MTELLRNLQTSGGTRKDGRIEVFRSPSTTVHLVSRVPLPELFAAIQQISSEPTKVAAEMLEGPDSNGFLFDARDCGLRMIISDGIISNPSSKESSLFDIETEDMHYNLSPDATYVLEVFEQEIMWGHSFMESLYPPFASRYRLITSFDSSTLRSELAENNLEDIQIETVKYAGITRRRTRFDS